MKTTTIILFFLSFYGFAQEKPVDFTIQQLYDELTYARANQKQYGKEHKLKLKNKKKAAFQKNNSLEEKAQKYAEYMANTGRYRHSRMNFNESIAYNYWPHNLLFELIEDKDVADVGHRKHLLSYNNKDTQVGIGVANDENTGRYYICVLTSN